MVTNKFGIHFTIQKSTVQFGLSQKFIRTYNGKKDIDRKSVDVSSSSIYENTEVSLKLEIGVYLSFCLSALDNLYVGQRFEYC